MNFSRFLKLSVLSLFLTFFSLSQTKAQAIQVKLDTISVCPGNIQVLVKVKDMLNVGAISLTMLYNNAVIQYSNSFVGNPALSVGTTVVSGAAGHLGVSWFSTTSVSIANGTLLTLNFNYTGGSTSMIWDTINSSNCEFSTVPGDILTSHYKNGYVSSNGFTASITSQPADVTICQDNNVVFSVTATTSTAYQWQLSTDNGVSFNNIATGAPYSGINSSQLQIASVPSSFNGHLYRCDIAGFCPPDAITDTVLLTVNGLATAFAGSDNSICAGDTLQLNGNATNFSSILWTKTGDGTFLNGGTLTPEYVPGAGDIAAGSVKLILHANGLAPCSNVTDTMTLVIHPIPNASAGNDTIICEGGTATLYGSGGTSYTWNTVPPSLVPVIAVSPVTDTWYKLTVSALGCSAVDSVKVSVVLKPVVEAGSNAAICEGQNFPVNGVASHYSSVSWSKSGDGDFIDSGNLSTVYIPGPNDINAGLVALYLAAFPNAPCLNPTYDTIYLTINHSPNVDAGLNANICVGQSTTLTATGGTSYVWSTVPQQSTVSVTVSPATTQWYFVTATALGCTAVDSVKVTVNPLPPLTLTPNSTICFGANITLQASGGQTYAWNTGSIMSFITVSPNITTTYHVTATGPNGCQASQSVTVTVNANLTVNITPLSPEICEGESIDLIAHGNQPGTYSWTPSVGLSDTIGPQVTANPVLTTTYHATIKDALGCLATATATVTVYPLPPVQVHPSVITICNGDTTTITATGALTYHWSPPTGLSSNNTASVLASPSDSTLYLVKGTDLHGCSSSVYVNIYVNPQPVLHLPESVFLCRGENYLLDATASIPFCDYLWQDGTTREFLYASSPGYYWVKATHDGCSVIDSTLILPCSELWVPNAFSPNNDGTNDRFLVGNNNDLFYYEIWIYDRWGELVYHSQDINTGWDGTFNGKPCPMGVYHWVVEYLGQGNVLLEMEGKKRGQVLLFR